MGRRSQFALLGAATAAAAVACAIGLAHIEGIGTGLLYLAPALLLALPLLHGRYVGERTVGRLAVARRAAPPRPTATALPASTRGPAARLPRGGRLVASAIATRPPPLLGL
jgi:hypothetical protein